MNEWGDELANEWGDLPADQGPAMLPSHGPPMAVSHGPFTQQQADLINNGMRGQRIKEGLVGAGDAFATLGSGLASYPAGLAVAGIDMLRGKGSEVAKRDRRIVEEKLQYLPRTEPGRQTVMAVGKVFEPFNRLSEKVGETVGEATGMPNLGGIAEEVTGAVVNPFTAIPIAKGAGRAARRGTAAVLKQVAEREALRAVNAPAAVGKLIDRGGLARPGEVARAMLDEPGVSMRQKPPELLQAINDAKNQKYGPRVGGIAAESASRGGTFDLGNVLREFNTNIAPEMMKDPNAQAIVQSVRDYLAASAQQRGRWGPTRQLLNFSPEEAHGLRQNLDTFLRGVTKTQDPTGTMTKVPFNKVRALVDDELSRAIEATGLGDQWAAANSDFRNIADASKLARAGARARAVEEASPTARGNWWARLQRQPARLLPSHGTRAETADALYRLLRDRQGAPGGQGMPPPPPPPPAVPGPAGGPPQPPPAAPPAAPPGGGGLQPGGAPGFTTWRPGSGPPPMPLPSVEEVYGPQAQSVVQQLLGLDKEPPMPPTPPGQAELAKAARFAEEIGLRKNWKPERTQREFERRAEALKNPKKRSKKVDEE